MNTANAITDSLIQIAKSAFPNIDHLAYYRARVVSQSGNRLDVIPDDARLSGFSNVEFKAGLPGTSVTFAPGAYVMIGFDGGDPSKPYIHSWESGATLTELKFGESLALDALLKGTTYRAHQVTFDAALTTFLGALGTYVGNIQPIADPPGTNTTAMATAITTFTAAVATFEAGAASYLSTIVKTV